MDDTFTLYDLKVEVVATDRPMVCSHKVGRLFSGTGGKPGFPEGYILFHVFFKCPSSGASGQAAAIGSE